MSGELKTFWVCHLDEMKEDESPSDMGFRERAADHRGAATQMMEEIMDPDCDAPYAFAVEDEAGLVVRFQMSVCWDPQILAEEIQ